DLKLPVLHAIYEELTDKDRLQALRKFAFQGASARCEAAAISEEPGWVKLHNGSLQELVGNFKEVQRTLKGTEFEWMLRD
ncbi:unnamed protein product, partial [Effrenium voratum]